MKSKLKAVMAIAVAASALVASGPAQAGPTIMLEGGMAITGAQAAAINFAVAAPLMLAVIQHERCVKTPGCLPKERKLVWKDASGQPVKTSSGGLSAH